MKKKIIVQLLSLILTFSLSACIAQASEKEETAGDTGDSVASVVYMTAEISPEGMMAVYEAMGVELTGDNIAVKRLILRVTRWPVSEARSRTSRLASARKKGNA